MPTGSRVTIGLPVFNGEEFLAEALESLLDQTYEHFEVVISDNGSTDATPEICARFAELDPRISYHRSERNRGATWNFNRVLELSRSEYFRWAAHDDVVEPTFLEKCVRALDEAPDAVLAHTGVEIIDANSVSQGVYERAPIRSSSPDPSTRFADLMLDAQRCYEVFGLVRRQALRDVPPMGNYGHADGALLARLGLVGRFIEIDEPLIRMRMHPSQSMAVYGCYGGALDYGAWASWFDLANAGKQVHPHWRLLYEYARSPLAVRNVRLADRVRCFLPLLVWIRRNGLGLAGDLRRSLRSSLFSTVPTGAKARGPLETNAAEGPAIVQMSDLRRRVPKETPAGPVVPSAAQANVVGHGTSSDVPDVVVPPSGVKQRLRG